MNEKKMLEDRKEKRATIRALKNQVIFLSVAVIVLSFAFAASLLLVHKIVAPPQNEVLSFEAELKDGERTEKEVAPQYVDLGEFKLTAYCSCEKCCGKWAENRPVDDDGKEIVYGSIGERLVQGVSVAVDPTVIPYGSTIEINGQEYKAHDCGGSIKGERIDVYFDSHEEALVFGVQYADVKLLSQTGV